MVPVLVVSGGLEANTPSAERRAVARKFANARFIEVPNTGHVPEAAEPCAAKIEIAVLRDLRVDNTRCQWKIKPMPVPTTR
jgi:pimeloyl-ACP methyl ester carboxylesterase